MSKFSRDTDVFVGDKKLKIEEILKLIIYLPADQVLGFFNDIGLTVPRELRIYVLRENLREKVAQTRKTRLTLADELNYRLSWFTEFTETQLENLLVFFDDQTIIKQYLEDLWTDLFGYMVEKEVPSFDIDRIYQLGLKHVKTHKLELPDIDVYNRTISKIFYDSFGRIDGVSPNKIRNVLFKSSTLNEIRNLGKKYDVDIPRRLKKNQLADIIVDELRINGEYTEDLEKQVRSMSVIIMQRFAIDHNIKASTELKKEEVIEYILKNATETKESYFIPNSRDVYEKELQDEAVKKEEPVVIVPAFIPDETVVEVAPQEESVEKTVSEEVEEEPVLEEVEEEPVLEEVEEEPVLEEEVIVEESEVVEKPKEVLTKVEYVAPAVNLDTLVEELKKLREAVETLKRQAVEKPVVEEALEEEIDGISLIDDSPKIEVINSAEFYGSPKSYKKLVASDEAAEREAFVQEQKAIKIAENNNKSSKDIPGEIRVLGKFFRGLGKVLWKVFKFVFKWALILALIIAIVLIGYTILVNSTELTFLDGVTDWLNARIDLPSSAGGRVGLIDKIAELLRSFGIIPEATP